MKLTKVRIQNYRSIEDSEEFRKPLLSTRGFQATRRQDGSGPVCLNKTRHDNPYQPFCFDEFS
jgi:hypothetical protein